MNRRRVALASIGLGVATGLLSFSQGSCRRPPRGFWEPPPEGTSIVCAVTGATCEKTASTPSAIALSKNYYFCTDEAWQRFIADPERFADPRP